MFVVVKHLNLGFLKFQCIFPFGTVILILFFDIESI